MIKTNDKNADTKAETPTTEVTADVKTKDAAVAIISLVKIEVAKK